MLDPTRKDRITASMVPWLMSGKLEVIQRLFLRAIGDPRAEPDSFGDSWASFYGLLVEQGEIEWKNRKFKGVLDYYADKTGCEFLSRGVQRFHPERLYVSATLDAIKKPDNIVVDVKATIDPRKSLDDIVSFYTPQMVVQEECARADGAALLIVRCGAEPIECPVHIEKHYRALVWQTVDAFWNCIETLTPPFELQFKQIVPPERLRAIDLDQDEDQPNWANAMRDALLSWHETETEAKRNDKAKADIKQLLPDDVGKVFYAGLLVSRSRNNAVHIKHSKAGTIS